MSTTPELPADSQASFGAASAGETPAVFTTTHWSVVVSARDKQSPASTEALEKLCRAYWHPLYAFIRRTGHAPADAEDLTQGFFARLLEKDFLLSATAEKGRFRSFLLTALKRFMANEWDRQHAQKRGGFSTFVEINSHMAESRILAEPASAQPDAVYDRQWALTLLGRTMALLEEEYIASGRAKLFEHLRLCLARDPQALPYAEIAARLHLTEPAVKMAVHRLRGRYREILQAEIAQTVASPEEAEEELRHLMVTFNS